MKRRRIRLLNTDGKFGHWWFEIGDPRDPSSESYGWWPKELGQGWRLLPRTMIGVPGELNGQTLYPTGRQDRDPHHDDSVDEIDDAFHAAVDPSDPRDDAQIMNCLRQFARSYAGKWQWCFGLGQNCHTFQKAAMKHCRLKRGPGARP